MPITYCTSGAWGSGVGRPLTVSEIDLNWRHLEQRLAALVGNRPVMPESTDSNGQTVTITMEDESEFSFDVPFSYISHTGEFEGGAAYAALESFDYNGSTYVVRFAHNAASTFSATALDSTGRQLYVRVTDNDTAPPIPEINFGSASGDNFISPGIDDVGRYFIAYENVEDPVIFYIPAESSINFPVGTVLEYTRWGGAQVEVGFPSGVTVNVPPGKSYTTLTWGRRMLAIKIGSDEWDLIGDLEDA